VINPPTLLELDMLRLNLMGFKLPIEWDRTRHNMGFFPVLKEVRSRFEV
jgi:hypothetical protein